MGRPSECRWCGSGVRSRGQFTTFRCWTSVVLDNGWSQSPECKLKGLEDRIKRAVDKLKASERYRVTPVSRIHVEYYTSDDGLVDSADVDEALAILEEERDETT